MKIELAGHYTYGRLLRSAFPSVMMMVITSTYGIIDGLFVSNYAGTTPFAAINIVWPMIMIFGALGLMLGAGGSALISKTMGEGDLPKANRIFSMLLRVALIAGLFFSVILFILAEPLSLFLGAEGKMVRECVIYTRINTLSLPLYMVQMAFQSYYMTAEKPQFGTIMSLVCGGINIIFDIILIIGLEYGTLGAAASTAIAQIAGGCFPLLYFSSKHNTSKLKIVKSGFEWKHIAQSCLNGLSEYVGNIAFCIVDICYNIQLMRYIGEEGVTAFGVVLYIGFIFAAAFFGYYITINPVVGFNYGAQNHDELHSLLKKSLVIIGVGSLLLTIGAELLNHSLVSLFVGYDIGLVNLSTHATRIYMVSFLLCGFNMFTSAWFTALNNGVVSAVSAFTRTLVFELGALFVLPLFMGLEGIWYAVNVAEVLAFVLTVSLLVKYREKYQY